MENIDNKEQPFDLETVERSIIKKYRRYLWSPFMTAIKKYRMIEPHDKIAVAISGGKDSLLMAKILQELARHSVTPFHLEFITMDPGFHAENKRNLLENCAKLNIPVHYFETDIFEVTKRISEDYPCYMCARMRRGALYGKAKEMGCNKLALGHHFDDVIETVLMNMLYTGTIKTMLPNLQSTSHPEMRIIRPLYHVREESILRFIQNSGVNAMNCGCEVAAGRISTKRNEMKHLIYQLKKNNPNVEKCIFNSVQNINLDASIGWKLNEEKFFYLDK